MTMDANSGSVALLTPAESPRPSHLSSPVIQRNLKVNYGRQSAHENIHSLPEQMLDVLDEKYNRRSIPLMTRKEFNQLVASVMCKRNRGPAATLKAAVAQHLLDEIHKLKTLLEEAKKSVFLRENLPNMVDDLLPFVQQESHHG